MSIATASIRPNISPEHRDAALPSQTPGAQHSRFTLWGDDGFTFGDLLDVVNPLQHIPVVATLYRAFSGDTIAAAPRLLGGALFGGGIGLAVAAANTLLEQVTGKDVGDHVLALLHVPVHTSDAPTASASTAPPFSPLPSPSTVRAEADQKERHIALVARATRQLRLRAALDTYAYNSRLLAAVRAGEQVNAEF
ncbi:MAG: hypothetical protein HYZ72_20235 [Deltaproteobacteria bacterium]|nr:hypothetical protein [Deltaproteobacteria bacterium]